MTVSELRKLLAGCPPEMDGAPVMIVRDDDRSDWANIVRLETDYCDPLDDEGEAPIVVILAG
jgi:hypothetical protein